MDEMFLKSKTQINEMCDSGMFNSIIEGYAIIAMKDAGFSENDIKKLNFAKIFDSVSAEQARKEYNEL